MNYIPAFLAVGRFCPSLHDTVFVMEGNTCNIYVMLQMELIELSGSVLDC